MSHSGRHRERRSRFAREMALCCLTAAPSIHAAGSPADEGLILIELDVPAVVRHAEQEHRRVRADALRSALEPVKRKLVADFGLNVVHGYDHLPLLAVRDDAAFRRSEVAAASGVTRVYEPPKVSIQINATDSANQMQAGIAEAAGFSGVGATVLVTDSGLGSNPPASIHADFGPCTAIGTPSTCQLRSYQVLDATGGNSHGTNVAAIVARTARGAGIHFADVGGAGTSISSTQAFVALNWAVANQAAENIVAHNMSWGGPAAACSASSNVFITARSAGIVQVAAAGNDSSSTSAAILNWPACNPYVTSVGAIESNLGGPATWTVAPFSNAESVLTFLAPGSSISAGGYSMSGTSQATPHVTGAYAILRAANAWHTMSMDDLTNHMRATGYFVTDTRLGLSFPVPMIHQARPVRLNVVNRFGVSYDLSPLPLQSCGLDCGNYRVGDVATISPPLGYVASPCSPPIPSTCQFALAANRTLVVQPDWVMPAVLNVLNGSVAGPAIFASGFEND